MIALWSYALAAVGILGLYLAGKGKRLGWAVGVGDPQLLWVAYATFTHQFGFYISAAAYAWVYSLNWWRWHKLHTAKAQPHDPRPQPRLPDPFPRVHWWRGWPLKPRGEHSSNPREDG